MISCALRKKKKSLRKEKKHGLLSDVQSKIWMNHVEKEGVHREFCAAKCTFVLLLEV